MHADTSEDWPVAERGEGAEAPDLLSHKQCQRLSRQFKTKKPFGEKSDKKDAAPRKEWKGAAKK